MQVNHYEERQGWLAPIIKINSVELSLADDGELMFRETGSDQDWDIAYPEQHERLKDALQRALNSAPPFDPALEASRPLGSLHLLRAMLSSAQDELNRTDAEILVTVREPYSLAFVEEYTVHRPNVVVLKLKAL